MSRIRDVPFRPFREDLELDPWAFAVELPYLQTSGVTVSDLRWLVCKGYVEHATETRPRRHGHRNFRRAGPFALTPQSCFALTEAGMALTRAGNGTVIHVNGNRQPVGRCTTATLMAGRPRWDQGARQLWMGQVLVKWFRVPAANQELILASFQEESWPPHIDDPLPPEYEIDPKKRLHDTINRLNGNQRERLIQGQWGRARHSLGIRSLTLPPDCRHIAGCGVAPGVRTSTESGPATLGR